MSAKTLNDYCEFIVDCLHKTAPIEETETGFFSIRTPDIGRGRLNIESANRVSEETYKKWTVRGIPEAGDLILAREAPVGNVGIVPKNVKVCCGQRTVHIRPDKSKISPEYLVYLMNGDEIQGKIRGYSQGVTVAHLNMEDIRALMLPELPPMSVQRRIADILSAYDDLIENNTRRIRILEQMAQAVYQEWFGMVKKESLPEGWDVTKLGDAIELAYGKGLKADQRIDGNYPVYGSAGVVGYHNEYLVKSPGIIVGRKGNVGSVFWSNKDFYPIDTTYFVRADISFYYIFFNLQTQNFINNDAAVPGLSRSQAYSLPFLLPSKTALDRFDEFIAPIFQQLEILNSKNANLGKTRDLLLPRLVSNEVNLKVLV